MAWRRFFFNDTAATEIYPLSLHDALPICFFRVGYRGARYSIGYPACPDLADRAKMVRLLEPSRIDRKSTRLNSSHSQISYAVFCLKKQPYVTSRARTTFVATPSSEQLTPS